ncbi:sulfotransferase family protein [Actinomadura sp. NBRC 104425]|uniref:sulfotransferase family protein n=1 Tax=Actinomadura sp. NBRC 104425 TaxID=3032204 RepID=UPI0024A46670|nr:sulfotransferase family protein [Actinomadura sp. NBRC 104425]GLZ14377.1 sulfotransferase family protein [Actinomadura sp. NBRC 104425]
MMRVIGAGLPRTGTASMKAALEQLGFGPCYHMFEVMAHPDHVDRWLQAASGAAPDWDRVMAGYRSCQDWPASFFWKELAEAYPRAKVVLTVRDPRRWYTSFRWLTSQAAFRQIDTEEVPDAVRPSLEGMRRLVPLLERCGRETFDGWRFGTDLPEAAALDGFHRLVARVREAIPADRLLVFDVREGWKPLCRFLDVDVPGIPFPHLNERDVMEGMFRQMVREGRLPEPFTAGS